MRSSVMHGTVPPPSRANLSVKSYKSSIFNVNDGSTWRVLTWYIDRLCHWPTEAARELAAKHVANARTREADMGDKREPLRATSFFRAFMN